jgi:hypothetical protein
LRKKKKLFHFQGPHKEVFRYLNVQYDASWSPWFRRLSNSIQTVDVPFFLMWNATNFEVWSTCTHFYCVLTDVTKAITVTTNEGKVGLKLSCTTKAKRGQTGIAPFSLNLGARRRSVVNDTLPRKNRNTY